MFSRREVKWGETGDHDNQGCSACGEDEASQYTRDEIMFPEIVECAKGVKILEGAQGGVNVGEARHRVVSARSSSESIESLGSKKSREPDQPMQGHRGLTLPSHSEAPGVLLKHQIVCHRCGQLGHIRSQCQRGERSCFTCGRLDHFMRNCPHNVSQSQPQSTQRQPTVSGSTSPRNVESQGRKRQREPNQPSQNQINLGPPTSSGNQRVSPLDKLCYVCRKPGHFARNCPQGSEVRGGSSSLQSYKRTPKKQQMQFRS